MCSSKDAVLVHVILHLTLIGFPLLAVHFQILQLLPSFLQSWCRGVLLDVGVLQVVEPLLKWGLGNGVELVHSDKEIFGENLFGCPHSQGVLVFGRDFQDIVGVYSSERSGAVVEVILAFAEVEIEDVDGIDFLHVVVFLA